LAPSLLTFVLGMVGMGKVQQQFFPDSSRPEILVDLWSPEGTAFAANEEVARRVEQRLMAEPGVTTVSTWVGSGVPRFYLPLDQIFPQTNVSQLIVPGKGPEGARDAAREAACLAGTGVPRGARPRQAAAQRTAGAVPGAVPGGGPDPLVLRELADEVKDT
jgi:multidrug efflux pump